MQWERQQSGDRTRMATVGDEQAPNIAATFVQRIEKVATFAKHNDACLLYLSVDLSNHSTGSVLASLLPTRTRHRC